MKRPLRLLALTLGFALLTGCGDSGSTSLSTAQSTLPSHQINALQIANVYRGAKAAGAPEFQGPVRAGDILTALESGVNGTGIHSDSTFRISPIHSADREKVAALLEKNLGL